jgi:hypothetical protein
MSHRRRCVQAGDIVPKFDHESSAKYGTCVRRFRFFDSGERSSRPQKNAVVDRSETNRFCFQAFIGSEHSEWIFSVRVGLMYFHSFAEDQVSSLLLGVTMSRSASR